MAKKTLEKPDLPKKVKPKPIYDQWGRRLRTDYDLNYDTSLLGLHHAKITIDEFLDATDGGVFYTGNATDNVPIFKEVNNGLNTLQFYTCAIHPYAYKVQYMGGLQDNGTLVYKGSPITVEDMVTSGDGAYCFFDNETPDNLL